MKLAVTALTALIALASVNGQNAVPDFGEGPLHDDMQFFISMIPMDEVERIILRYSVQDPEFRQALSYLMSDDFKNLVSDIEHVPQVLYFLEFLEVNGIYAYDIVNKLNSMLGIPETVPYEGIVKNNYMPATDGLAGLFRDMKELISYDQFIHGYAYKMKTSPAFFAFVQQLKSQNFQDIIDFIYAHPTFLHVRSFMVAAGVNVKLVEDIMFTVLGTNFPDLYTPYARDDALNKDLEEFLNMALTEDILRILVLYIEEDPEVQRGIEYTNTPEYQNLIRKIEATKQYQALLEYLKEAGVEIPPIEPLLQNLALEASVSSSEINQKYASMISSQAPKPPGFRGMAAQIKAALPSKELKELFNLKMKTSPAFAKLITYVRAPQFEKLATAVYKHPNYTELIAKAKAHGLDLKAFDELVFAIYHFIKTNKP